MAYLVIKESNAGKGVFANKNFKRLEKIIDFKIEPIVRSTEIPDDPETNNNNHYLQIGKHTYLGPSGEIDDYFNHSCDPNSGLKISKNKVTLISIKKIKKGEEITFDYSTTMYNDRWTMRCVCESRNCRKIIGNFADIPKEIKKKYIRLSVIP